MRVEFHEQNKAVFFPRAIAHSLGIAGITIENAGYTTLFPTDQFFQAFITNPGDYTITICHLSPEGEFQTFSYQEPKLTGIRYIRRPSDELKARFHRYQPDSDDRSFPIPSDSSLCLLNKQRGTILSFEGALGLFITRFNTTVVSLQPNRGLAFRSFPSSDATEPFGVDPLVLENYTGLHGKYQSVN